MEINGVINPFPIPFCTISSVGTLVPAISGLVETVIIPRPVSYTHLDVYKRQVVCMLSKYSIPLAIIGGIAAGAAIGAINGYFYVNRKIKSFIVTI